MKNFQKNNEFIYIFFFFSLNNLHFNNIFFCCYSSVRNEPSAQFHVFLLPGDRKKQEQHVIRCGFSLTINKLLQPHAGKTTSWWITTQSLIYSTNGRYQTFRKWQYLFVNVKGFRTAFVVNVYLSCTFGIVLLHTGSGNSYMKGNLRRNTIYRALIGVNVADSTCVAELVVVPQAQKIYSSQYTNIYIYIYI